MLPFPSFDYVVPTTLEEAVRLCAEPGAIPVAGGTDLLPSLKHRLFEPAPLVSLSRLPELRGIEATPDGGLSIGAGVTLREVSRHPDVRRRWPGLAAACETVGTPTLQAMGTLGGNLMLDTRCMYYNQPAGWRASIGGCLKKDGTVCHVAPRGKGCYAAHSSDTVPVLWLCGARARYSDRDVSIRDMYQPDGMDWLKVRGLLVRIELPPPEAPVVHRKGRTRAAIDYGWLLAAVRRDPAGYRAVVSAVGPAPVEVVGEDPAALAEAAFQAVQPLSTHLAPATWRKKMVRVEVRRAAESLG